MQIKDTGENSIGAFINEQLTDMTVVHVLGEIDLSNVRQFEDAIDRASTEKSTEIDLQYCTYLDSSAVNALLKSRNRLGTQLHVRARERGVVKRIFDVMGLSETLQVDYRA